MKVTPAMVKAGEDIASHLISASCQKSFGTLGGCKGFDIEQFPEEYRDLITDYTEGTIVSVTAIYLAMERQALIDGRNST